MNEKYYRKINEIINLLKEADKFIETPDTLVEVTVCIRKSIQKLQNFKRYL